VDPKNGEISRSVEIPARDADVLKGVGQLKQIRQFLLETLITFVNSVSCRGACQNTQNVHYLLVARDRWLWIEPEDGIAIAEFEAFAAALCRYENLHSAVTELLRYEWLPVEGRDLRVKYDRSTANGVSIECEVFYRLETDHA
jgi:hypothetical protein